MAHELKLAFTFVKHGLKKKVKEKEKKYMQQKPDLAHKA